MSRVVRLMLAMLVLVLGTPAEAQAPSRCTGSFINPVTDVCWGCLFPLSVGSIKIWGSNRADTQNPGFPLCACGSPIPRIGVALGFWEPVRLIDVTTKPFCFPNLGGIKLNPGFNVGNGDRKSVV